MNKYIAYCGLDCKKCEARIATINNDEKMKEKVAKEWSDLNKVEITKEMINCEGCKLDGVKFTYCSMLCPIRKCAMSQNMSTCGKCEKIDSCAKVAMVIKNNKEAYNNLKG